jgi:integrase
LYYTKNELPQRAPSTAYLHRHIIHDFLIPRWANNIAVGIKPLDVENWLKALHGELGYANPSCAKIRQVMVCVYKHAQRHGLIPRTEDANPMKWVRCKTTSDYEAIILTPEQAFHLVRDFPPLERTLTLLAAATGLRISECLGLQWQDLDFEHEQIHVRRTWLGGQIGETKTKASKQPVAMGALLADIMREWQNQTSHANPRDWVFPSQRLHGRKPRTGSVMAQHYLRPAAARLGILAAEDRRRFGFRNLRHSLASYLVTQTKTDVKTVQSMLRHADVGTTLGLYTHAINKDKLVAQNQVMEAMRKPGLVN